jgi:hypothetical protein
VAAPPPVSQRQGHPVHGVRLRARQYVTLRRHHCLTNVGASTSRPAKLPHYIRRVEAHSPPPGPCPCPCPPPPPPPPPLRDLPRTGDPDPARILEALRDMHKLPTAEPQEEMRFVLPERQLPRLPKRGGTMDNHFSPRLAATGRDTGAPGSNVAAPRDGTPPASFATHRMTQSFGRKPRRMSSMLDPEAAPAAPRSSIVQHMPYDMKAYEAVERHMKATATTAPCPSLPKAPLSRIGYEVYENSRAQRDARLEGWEMERQKFTMTGTKMEGLKASTTTALDIFSDLRVGRMGLASS